MLCNTYKKKKQYSDITTFPQIKVSYEHLNIYTAVLIIRCFKGRDTQFWIAGSRIEYLVYVLKYRILPSLFNRQKIMKHPDIYLSIQMMLKSRKSSNIWALLLDIVNTLDLFVEQCYCRILAYFDYNKSIFIIINIFSGYTYPCDLLSLSREIDEKHNRIRSLTQ